MTGNHLAKVGACMLTLSACANMSEGQKGALGGAAIGAASGAGIAALADGNVGVGALAGGAIGAVAGGMWRSERPR